MVPDLIKYVEREHGVNLTPEDFERYSLEDIWANGKAQGEIVFENYKRQVTTKVAPVEGSITALTKLSRKYDVIVTTSRDIKVEKVTRDWLDYHFPQLFKGVHLLGNSKDSITWRSKADVCQELGVYCLVDDSLKQVLEAHAVGLQALLFGDYPWNQVGALPEGVTRVKDWSAVLEFFNAKG